MIRGILIDPETRLVSEVEIEPGRLDDYYRHLGCSCFDVVGLQDGDVVFVDGEGLMKPNTFFLIEGHPTPLAGRGLVLGTDAEGNSITPSVSLDWVRDNIDIGMPMKVGETILFMGERNVREIH